LNSCKEEENIPSSHDFTSETSINATLNNNILSRASVTLGVIDTAATIARADGARHTNLVEAASGATISISGVALGLPGWDTTLHVVGTMDIGDGIR
jgi:hypothetical protein